MYIDKRDVDLRVWVRMSARLAAPANFDGPKRLHGGGCAYSHFTVPVLYCDRSTGTSTGTGIVGPYSSFTHYTVGLGLLFTVQYGMIV